MANFSEKITKGFKRFLPNPFTIAIFLTVITYVLALILTKPTSQSVLNYSWYLIESWETGLWDSSKGGLYFAFQMMMMLVLGHCLALSSPISSLMDRILVYCKNTVSSALVITISVFIMGILNWGLGLIFGAILARKIGEKFQGLKRPINFGLIVACGYIGMMVWHGGLSGSAPTKVMEDDYLTNLVTEFSIHNLSEEQLVVPFEKTIGSGMNIFAAFFLLILISITVFLLAKYTKNETVPEINKQETKKENQSVQTKNLLGAEKLDRNKWFGTIIGIALLFFGLIKILNYEGTSSLGFIQPNFINYCLFGWCLFFHKSIYQFLQAIQEAISDISGILIQFPLYFGILAIMKSSGLIVLFSEVLIEHASASTLPIYTFFSAGLVNFFVPSGGGQWAIQGPIILQAAAELQADIPKSIMAMAYGDQLTNMLQPFWALPLLGITKIEAYKILPYTFLFFFVGLLCFIMALFIF